MATRSATRVSVTLASVLLLSLVGCQKNSHQTCVDFQTEVAAREYERNLTLQPSVTLQMRIDWRVSDYCRGVK